MSLNRLYGLNSLSESHLRAPSSWTGYGYDESGALSVAVLGFIVLGEHRLKCNDARCHRHAAKRKPLLLALQYPSLDMAYSKLQEVGT